MLIALDRLGIRYLVRILYAVMLSISSGVARCRCPNSSRHMYSSIVSLVLAKIAPISLLLVVDII